MQKKKIVYIVLPAICIIGIVAALCVYFFSSVNKGEKSEFLYIDSDDNCDSIFYKLSPFSNVRALSAFKIIVRHTDYAENIKTGRYEIVPGDGPISVFYKLKSGKQTPLNLTIPSVRTMEDMAGYLGSKLMADSTQFIQVFKNDSLCKELGYDTATIACTFIPNTYQVYWNISIDKFMKRMKKESDNFWNEARLSKAENCGMTKEQVITLASIVDEETANKQEKPMVAGMYINRLKQEIPLQADPTIKFALKDFSLKRIYHKHLTINSPYNTYRNIGLPPGPIRIPTIDGIDAVLNHAQHDYIYMCAKEDLSGTHNFATTYEEHLKNAAKYAKALNERGIK